MFGYITADPRELPEDERNAYRAAYCGVCRALREKSGVTGRFSLTYETAFLTLVLLDVYGEGPEIRRERCVAHPLVSHEYMVHPFVSYAADMNLLLMYYKLLDDWQDDKNAAAKLGADLFRRKVTGIEAAYPAQSAAVTECLAALSEMEKADEMNADRPANCFGHLMGAVFAARDDEKARDLYAFGAALGRFVYILDAACDLRSDIRKKRYNPLMMTDPKLFDDILAQMMNEAVAAAGALSFPKYRHLIENVLYSGVWMKYSRNRVKKENGQ